MSFTTEVKSEIAGNELKPCCSRAQLAALLQLNATLTIVNKNFQLQLKTENPTTAKRMWLLIKERYKVVPELSMIRKMQLKKNTVYIIKIMHQVKEILEDVGLWDETGLSDRPARSIVVKDCCNRAYLAGAFLATGSVNAPIRSNYHLEIACNNEKHAVFVQKCMNRYQLPAKVIKRRHQDIVYIKASDKISDFMRATGAFQSVMKFEDVRIQRDFKNSLTRLDNCEVANEMKTISAATKQLADIELLQKVGRFEYLEPRLKEVALLRIQFPEASFNELSKEYESMTGTVMSKSGMKHRFNRLHDIAAKIHFNR